MHAAAHGSERHVPFPSSHFSQGRALVWLQLLGRLLRYSDELRYWLSKPTVCGGAQSSWDIVHFSSAHI